MLPYFKKIYKYNQPNDCVWSMVFVGFSVGRVMFAKWFVSPLVGLVRGLSVLGFVDG